MKKRWPRGMIYSNEGWSGIGEEIEQGDHGIFYFAEGSARTIFVPYTSIDRIKYEITPEEVVNGRIDTSKNDSNKK